MNRFWNGSISLRLCRVLQTKIRSGKFVLVNRVTLKALRFFNLKKFGDACLALWWCRGYLRIGFTPLAQFFSFYIVGRLLQPAGDFLNERDRTIFRPYSNYIQFSYGFGQQLFLYRNTILKFFKLIFQKFCFSSSRSIISCASLMAIKQFCYP